MHRVTWRTAPVQARFSSEKSLGRFDVEHVIVNLFEHSRVLSPVKLPPLGASTVQWPRLSRVVGPRTATPESRLARLPPLPQCSGANRHDARKNRRSDQDREGHESPEDVRRLEYEPPSPTAHDLCRSCAKPSGNHPGSQARAQTSAPFTLSGGSRRHRQWQVF